MSPDEVIAFEKGGTHLNTKCFGFTGACDDTAIIVGEDNNRSPFQGRIKYSFAGHIEVVAVHKGKDFFHWESIAEKRLQAMNNMSDHTPDLKIHFFRHLNGFKIIIFRHEV